MSQSLKSVLRHQIGETFLHPTEIFCRLDLADFLNLKLAKLCGKFSFRPRSEELWVIYAAIRESRLNNILDDLVLGLETAGLGLETSGLGLETAGLGLETSGLS